MKYLLTTLLALCMVHPCQAGMMMLGGGTPVAASGCSGSYGNQLTTDAGGIGDGAAQCFVRQITGACDGTTASITIRHPGSAYGGTSYAVIYADSAGEPGALLGSQSYAVSASVPPFSSTINMAVATGATTFWVGFCNDGWTADAEYSSLTGGTARARYNITNPASPPNPWTANGTADGDYNAYNFEFYVSY